MNNISKKHTQKTRFVIAVVVVVEIYKAFATVSGVKISFFFFSPFKLK